MNADIGKWVPLPELRVAIQNNPDTDPCSPRKIRVLQQRWELALVDSVKYEWRDIPYVDTTT